jgi:PhnB protein
MLLNPYLTFNGQCDEAFKFYEKYLGGKIEMSMTFRESPMAAQVPMDWQDKILHATLTLGDRQLQGADAPPGRYERPRGFSVALHVATAPEADRIFASLSENGIVQFVLQETFWALRFGMVIDQFGTPWMINCGRTA